MSSPDPPGATGGLARRALAALLFVLCAAGSVRAEPVDAQAIDALVQRSLKSWRVPGVAVAVVRDGEVIYLKGHGVRARGTSDPVTPDTLFPIASCSKTFTTTALALLVGEGKVSWDDPVRRHVPFFHLSDPLADGDVRLRDLLCHRTGLAGHDLLWYRSPWSHEEVIRRVGRLPLDRPFRTAFQYQSTMFVAAGLAVASASGRPWADFVRERLLVPLDMTSTVFTSGAAERVRDRARPHRRSAEGAIEVIPFYPMEVPDPAGSVHSTARDLAKWLRFHLRDGLAGQTRLVPAAVLAEMRTPQVVVPMTATDRVAHRDTVQMSYGLGWVIQDYRGVRLVSHGGVIDGFRSHLTMVPEKGLGIVLLNNLHRTHMNQAISYALLDQLLGLPPRDWDAHLQGVDRRERAAAHAAERERLARRQPGTRPSCPPAAYAGEYEHPAYGTVRVAWEGDDLVWRWNHWSATLQHFHFDTFILPIDFLGHPEVIFTPDGRGGVERMKVRGPFNIEFRRRVTP